MNYDENITRFNITDVFQTLKTSLKHSASLIKVSKTNTNFKSYYDPIFKWSFQHKNIYWLPASNKWYVNYVLDTRVLFGRCSCFFKDPSNRLRYLIATYYLLSYFEMSSKQSTKSFRNNFNLRSCLQYTYT